MVFLFAVVIAGLVVMVPALVWGFYLLGLLCLGLTCACVLCHGTERLSQEWQAMWHPLTRYLPAFLTASPCTIALLLGLPALVLAHTLGSLLAVALR
jgi:hypothetical protein